MITFSFGYGQNLFLEWDVPGIKEMVVLKLRKSRFQEFSFLPGAHSSKNFTALVEGHRNGCLAHPPAAGVNEHSVAGFYPPPEDQSIVSGGVDHGDGGRLLQGPALRYWPQEVGGHIHMRGKALEIVVTMLTDHNIYL